MDRLTAYWPKMDRRQHPGVDTFCFYGYGYPTEYSYVFSGHILENKPVDVLKMDGDADQDIMVSCELKFRRVLSMCCLVNVLNFFSPSDTYTFI